METVVRTRHGVTRGRKPRKESLSSPAVAIILPFQPTLMLKSGLAASVSKAISAVRLVLSKKQFSKHTDLVIEKLLDMAGTLNYWSTKKSVALYASPTCEKIIYLDTPVNERITVGDALNIRDLLYAKKQELPFLLFCISNNASRLFLCNNGQLNKILENSPGMAESYLPLMPVKKPFGYYSQQAPEEKYLVYLDRILHQLLAAFPYPLILLGKPALLNSFDAITEHRQAVVEYIPVSDPLPGRTKLEALLSTPERHPSRLYQKLSLNLVTYVQEKRIVSGIIETWRVATTNHGQLLLIDEGLVKQHNEFLDFGMQQPGTKTHNTISDANDVIGQTIEKIFENGGDVQLIQEGILPVHQKAILIF